MKHKEKLHNLYNKIKGISDAFPTHEGLKEACKDLSDFIASADSEGDDSGSNPNQPPPPPPPPSGH